MTGFDAFAILVVLGSCGMGWMRGATRELVALLSFVLAAFLALIALPFTGPMGRALIDPDWAGSVFAVVAAFLVIYFGLRILGSIISQQTQANPHLGGVDRFLGFSIGVIRALLVLGVVHLLVVAALPGERTPKWLTQAVAYPISMKAARTIQIILPGIGRGADAIVPFVDSSVRRGFSDDEALRSPQTHNTSRPQAAR